MIAFSSKYRSTQDEIMDDFNLKGEAMKKLMTDLKRVNTLLGGNSVTINGLEYLFRGITKDRPVTIMDIGCGDGEMLRQVAKWAHRTKRSVKLIGIDANDYILSEAKVRSSSETPIEFVAANIFDPNFRIPEFDIALCTLFLHHLKESQICNLLKSLASNAKVGVVINDLERSGLAFRLFKLFGWAYLKSEIAKHDGLVSVARGFKKKELNELSQQIKADHSIRWKWAFRYQWIIKV